jgi:hypothetical protein
MSTIQCNKNALLSGSSIPLFQRNIIEFDGVLGALIYQQINYLSESRFHNGMNIKAARVSYTRLQEHIPSVTRRSIIRAVAALRDCGAIKVFDTKRVNLLAINDEYQFKSVNEGNSPMLVFPELLKKMRLLDAIALQQIHLRCVGKDGSLWVTRTLDQLQSQIFWFVSLATVKRVIASLRRQELIYVKPHSCDDGVVNSYRVNYQKLAQLIEVPVPEVVPPAKHSGRWKNPVFPLEPSLVVG